MGFWFNQTAGAVLMACLVILGVNALADMFYAVDTPEQQGYPIEVADTGGHSSAGGADAKPEGPSLAALLAEADTSKGERLFKQCVSCHTAVNGGADGTGPNLWGIVGHDIGANSAFAYSKGMAALEGNWTFETLNAFLEKPKGLIRDTKMSFAGVRRPADRAALMAWLNDQSDSPIPLPAVEAAPAADEAAGEAADGGEAHMDADHGDGH